MQSSECPSTMSSSRTECIDLSDYCRLCLQLPGERDLLDLQLIYDEDEHLSYYDCFTICTQIDLRAGGTYAPHQLCKSCGLELQVAYDFHKKVEESKKFLIQFEKSASTTNIVQTAASTTSTEEESVLHKPAEEAVNEASDDTEYETKLFAPEVLQITKQEVDDTSQLDTSMEYEELEEQVDILDEYQSVEELGEDAETVQIIINEESYEIQKFNPSDNIHAEVTSLSEIEHEPTTINSESNSESNNPSCKITELNKDDRSSVTFQYEIEESDSEATNPNKQKSPQGQMQRHEEEYLTVETTDLDTVAVITKTGDLRPRKRYCGEHSCDYCKKVFKNRSRMLTHRRSHETDRKKFKCEECGRLYATKQARGVHMNTTHNKTETGLKCPICGKVYVIQKLLDIHMRYHTGDFPYVCDLCGRKFAQMCHLNTHKNVKHNSERFTCEHPGCGKYFTSSSSLRNHEFSHSEMPFECMHCKRGYPARSKLKAHIRQKHGLEVTLEQMEDMHKDNDEPATTLKLEEESMHNPQEIIYDNDGDDDEGSSAQYASAEVSESEPNVWNFGPPSETDEISLEEYLLENSDVIVKPEVVVQEQPDSSTQPSTSNRRHGRAPVIPGGPPYQCEYCEHKSKSRALLASHRFRKHRFNKPYFKCDKCDKDFTTKQQLERHMQRITCETYPEFKCEFCEKICTGRANYQIHLRFHRKVYPFVCHICAKPFMMAVHMKHHVKTKHEGQRFICDYEGCGKMFQTAHALKNHVYTHVEQLPYRCDYCQSEFSTKGRLRWHISRIHGIEHTLDELDCMLVAKEIKVKAHLQPALPPEPRLHDDVLVANELDVEEC